MIRPPMIPSTTASGGHPLPADRELTPLRADIVGGLTTFLTMAYIVVVNPGILASPATGMPFAGVMAATVVVAAAMTLLMGLYAKLPFGVAPGMGLNAFLAFTVIAQRHVPWPVALGMVFWAGVLFLLLSLTPLRERIADAIPANLRAATAAGIGLLLTFLGLRNAGLVVGDPVTLVRIGTLDHRAALLLAGLAVSVVLMRRRNPFAFVAAIAAVTLVAWTAGYDRPPAQYVSRPDFGSVFLQLDPLGALRLIFVPTIVTIAFTDLFDSLSTFVGVSTAAGLVEADGRPRRLRQGLIVDAWATLGAALAGSSPGTAYVESIAGIQMGARTGRASVVTALCFVPCLFLAPLAGSVPAYATAPVLVLVGVAMFRTVQQVDFGRVELALPAFVALVLIPLTFSITQGILWGFVLHALLHLLAGRGPELSAMQWALGVICAGLILLERLS